MVAIEIYATPPSRTLGIREIQSEKEKESGRIL
jgi:hypothetical protein